MERDSVGFFLPADAGGIGGAAPIAADTSSANANQRRSGSIDKPCSAMADVRIPITSGKTKRRYTQRVYWDSALDV